MSISVVSLHDRPELGPEAFSVLARNQSFISVYRYGTVEQDEPVSLQLFRECLKSTIHGTPVLDSTVLVDIRAILQDDYVVGVMSIEQDTESDDFDFLRTVGVVIDIDGGYGRQGFGTLALQQTIDKLFDTGDVEVVEAFTHRENTSSRGMLVKAGFLLEKNYVDSEFSSDRLRYLAVDDYLGQPQV